LLFCLIFTARAFEHKRVESRSPGQACYANRAAAQFRRRTDEGRRPMKMIAYVLAIICAIAAVMYFAMPAGSLPTFMPGYAAGSEHIHKTHALAAAVAAIVLFGIGWFSGRR
jgi:hypothetical protein